MYLKPASSIQHFLKTKWCYSLSIRFLSYGNDSDITVTIMMIIMIVTIIMIQIMIMIMIIFMIIIIAKKIFMHY